MEDKGGWTQVSLVKHTITRPWPEREGAERETVGRAAFLAEGLCWHPLVRAGVAHPGPTAEGQGPQPGEQAVSHGQYWE